MSTPKKKKYLWGILAVVAGVGLLLCLWFLLRPEPELVLPTPSPQETTSPTLAPVPTYIPPPQDTPTPVEIPVDFTALQEENPDIYAWIQMPGTIVDYPILQRFGDDTYYLRRSVDGSPSTAGSLFTEYRYNSTEFNDPVTVIYGHDMQDGSMFGSLQLYNETLTLDEDAVFYIYQPGRRMTYRIFAAIPYNNSHILYYHDFQDERTYTRFFEAVYETRNLYTNLDPDAAPVFGDRVVILATCLKGDNTQRFLMMGVLTEDTASSLS